MSARTLKWRPSRGVSRMVVLGGSIVLIGFLIVFVFPTQALMDTRNERNSMATKVEEMQRENESLRKQTAALQTEEVIERIARSRYGFVMPGETAYSVRIPASASQGVDPALQPVP